MSQVSSQESWRSGIIWDNHGCMPLRPDGRFLPQLERYRDASVNVVSLNVGFAEMHWNEQLRILSYMRRWVALHSEKYHLIQRVDDISFCKARDKLGIVFDIEGMFPVQDDLSLVQTFYELGVRWMLIAYNRNSAAGGGCLDEDGGLTAIGRSIIGEMERVGMVLCLSHCGRRTAEDAISCATNPIIFSHSNPFGHTPHARNIPDHLIRACARKGGVMGLSGFGPYLGGNGELVPKLLEQFRYVIDLVGPEHVGLGLDYVFDASELEGFVRANPEIFPAEIGGSSTISMIGPESIQQIAEGLARLGLTDQQAGGILGGNWLRVAKDVWR